MKIFVVLENVNLENSADYYTVVFKNYDNSKLCKCLIKIGEIPTYKGNVPVKNADLSYSYKFNGWNKNIDSTVNDDVETPLSFGLEKLSLSDLNNEPITYYSLYKEILNVYEVKINRISEEGYVETIKFNCLNKDEKLAEITLTSNNAQYTYSWDKELPTSLELQNYEFSEVRTLNSYKITWMNGENIERVDTISYGESPVYGDVVPLKEETELYTYEFIGWDPLITAVVSDATYTAVFKSKSKVEISLKFNKTDDFIYVIGNNNSVSVNNIFNSIGATINHVSILSIDGASGSYDLTNNEVKFNGYGIVKVTASIRDVNDSSTILAEKTIYLQVVDGYNTTDVFSACDVNENGVNCITNKNVVLLNNIGIGYSSFRLKDGRTLYGNGFTISSSYIGYGLANYMANGRVELNNANLDNVVIKTAIYPRGYLYVNTTSNGEALKDTNNINTRFSSQNGNYYNYQYNAVTLSGKCKISNCYIVGSKTNIYINEASDGTIISDTRLESGALANIYIAATSGTITFKNLTTVQEVRTTNLTVEQIDDQGGDPSDANKSVIGCGILIGNDETNSYPTIIFEGTYNQYNWVKKGTTVSSTVINKIINAVSNSDSAFMKTINNETYMNVAIFYLTNKKATIINNSNESSNYKLSNLNISGASGQAYGYIGNADENCLGAPSYLFELTNTNKNSINVKCSDVDYAVTYEYNAEEKELVPTIKSYIAEGEEVNLSIKDLLIIRSSKKYIGSVFKVNDEVVNSDYIINCNVSNNFVITISGETSGYYDHNMNYVDDSRPFIVTIYFNVIEKAIELPKFIVKESYNSNSNLFTSSTSGDHTVVAKALNDIYVTYYSKSRKNYVTVSLNVFTPSTNGKLDKTWTGTYDECTLTIESTQAIHASKSDFGYFIISDGVMYLTNSNKVSSGSGARQCAIKYTFTDNNSQTISLSPGARTENRSAAKSTSSSSKYMVRLDYGFSGVESTEMGPYSANTNITLPNPTREGYVFLGWYDSPTYDNRKDNDCSYTSTSSNVVLYARWTKAIEHTVTFDSTNGTTPETVSYYGYTQQILPSPKKDGYWFVGWFDEENAGNKIGNAGSKYTYPIKDTTYYARWSPIYTVSYDANGGSCKTLDTFEGVNIVLPTPTINDNKKIFAGWYLGEEKINVTSYVPSSNVVLTAHWETKVTITFNANGGNSGLNPIETSLGSTVKLSDATRTGYTFVGWSETIDGEEVDKSSYVATKDIELFAKWTINKYKVTLSLSNATGSVTYNGYTISNNNGVISNVTYGDTVTVKCDSFSQSNNKTIKYGSSKLGSDVGSYSFKMPADNVTVSMSSEAPSGGCFTGDTLIDMSDGTKKRADELSVGEEILTFNHNTGTLENSLVAYIFYSVLECDVLKLSFECDCSITILQAHCFYNLEENKYIEISKDNYNDYIGYSFYNGDINEFIKLVSCELSHEIIETYSILSAYNINHFANGFLVVSDDIQGLFNYFDYDESLKYDEEKMNNDIKIYGLVTYEMFKDYCTEEEFNVFNCKYLNVSIGKGLTTIESLIERMMIFSGNSK